MRKGLLIMLASALLLVACGKKKLPKGVLPRDKMEAVVWDMLQADEFLRDFILKDSTLNDTTESIRLYEKVFQFNKTNREEFATSFNYYRTHTKLLQEVMDSLNLKSAEAAPTEVFQPPVVTVDSNLVKKDTSRLLKDTIRKIPRIDSLRIPVKKGIPMRRID